MQLPFGMNHQLPDGNQANEKLDRNETPRPLGFPTGLLVCGLLVVIVWGVAAARPFLVPVSISALLAFLMAPVVRLLVRWRLPEGLAILASAVLMILPFLVIVFFAVEQGQSLVRDFPSIVSAVNTDYTHFAESSWGHRLNLTAAQGPSTWIAHLSGNAEKGVSLMVGGLSALLDATSQLALIIIFSVVMLSSRAHLRSSCERILERAESIRAAQLLDEVTDLIQQFLIARLLIVGIVATAAVITLRAFGVTYSFMLGTFDGVMTLVPAVGFVVALVPILIVAFATGHAIVPVLILGAILIAISFLEGNVLTPKLVGRRLNINTLASFLGFLAGGLLWGVWGMFLSVPILGVIRIVFSAVPGLQPWGDLLAERQDRKLSMNLIRRRPEDRSPEAATTGPDGPATP